MIGTVPGKEDFIANYTDQLIAPIELAVLWGIQTSAPAKQHV